MNWEGLISIALDFKEKRGWLVFFYLQLKVKYGDTAKLVADNNYDIQFHLF